MLLLLLYSFGINTSSTNDYLKKNDYNVMGWNKWSIYLQLHLFSWIEHNKSDWFFLWYNTVGLAKPSDCSEKMKKFVIKKVLKDEKDAKKINLWTLDPNVLQQTTNNPPATYLQQPEKLQVNAMTSSQFPLDICMIYSRPLIPCDLAVKRSHDVRHRCV